MAAKKTYAAPTTGIVRTPKGVAKGVGIQYDPRTGQPTGFVKTSFAPGVGLAPGMGIKYVNGKPVAFQKAPPKGGYRAPAAPAATPAALPAPAGPVPRPPDEAYLGAYNAATQTRDLSLAGLTGQRTRGLSDYGFTEGSYDPSAANFGALTVDPSNPFSKASLLKQTYDQSRRASAQQMGSQGNLYAGSFQNQQDLVNRNQLGAEDTLQKSLQDFLVQNTSDYGQAGIDFNTAISQAESDRMGRITDSPLYEPTPPAAAAPVVKRGAGLPQKTVNGRRFYQRASDKKWIPF